MLRSLRLKLAKALLFLRRLLLPPRKLHVAGMVSSSARLEALHLRPREIAVSDNAAGHERVDLEKLQHDQIIGIRISDSQGTSLAADQLDGGALVDYKVWGRSRQNEEGVQAVCRVLVQRLNADGGAWADPILATGQLEQGIDCESSDGNAALLIQITRAEPSKRIWSQLSSAGQVSDTKATAEAADVLRTAIERKAAKIPSDQRPGLTLALDATETAALALEPVVVSFRQRHGSLARSLGFNSIWVVGPNPRLTSRLDAVT